jgi:hypothetical protein
MVAAVSPQRATRVLNKVAADCVQGSALNAGRRISVPGGPLLEVVEMSQHDAHLDFAVALCGPDVRALQLVWADGHGRWPWSAEFCDGRRRQPVLGLRTQNA